MNRVVVATDFGVAPPNIAVGVPAGRFRQRLRFAFLAFFGLPFKFQAAHQHAAGFAPQKAKAIFGFGDQVECAAFGMWLQVVGKHRKVQPVDTTQGAQHLDAVVQVYQAQQWEREAVGGQQLQLQVKRHDMGVGARQAAVIGEVAQIAVRREIAGLHRDEAAQAIGWQGVAADLAFAGRAQIKACA
ncbi:hypothetical protein D3C73_1248520 [compost metagenome]